MLFIIPFIIAVFLALNMGGSGTAPSFSVAYGAGIVKRSTIPFLFGFFVLLGAIIADFFSVWLVAPLFALLVAYLFPLLVLSQGILISGN